MKTRIYAAQAVKGLKSENVEREVNYSLTENRMSQTPLSHKV